jgi:hypothetical protein
MSQWGAEGLATRGFSYPDILQHYYTGVSIGTYPSPKRIDVGVSTGNPSVSVSGAFEIVAADGKTLVKEALGTWRFQFAGTGVVAVDPPQGYGLPLDVGVVRAPRKVRPGGRASITYALSRPARIKVLATGIERKSSFRVSGAGRDRLTWRAPQEPGRYEVHVVARAGGRLKRDSVGIRVVAPEADEPQIGEPLEPVEAPDGDTPWLWVGAGIFLGLALIFWVIKVTMSS